MRKLLALLACTVALTACSSGAGEKVSLFHWDLEVDRSSPVYQEIRRQTGLEIEPVSAPWSEWFQKLNTLAASGALPDVFVSYGPGDADGYEKMVKDGLILALDPFFATHPNIGKRLAERDRQRIDGHYYAVPVETTTDHTFIIRHDRLEQTGLSAPESVDELYDVAKAFKDAYGGYPVSSSPRIPRDSSGSTLCSPPSAGPGRTGLLKTVRTYRPGSRKETAGRSSTWHGCTANGYSIRSSSRTRTPTSSRSSTRGRAASSCTEAYST